MAGKPRKKKGSELPESVLAYVKALQFVSPVQDETTNGAVFNTFCRVGGGQIIATDGATTLGYPIDDTLECCPHTLRLLAALLKCDGTVQLTMLPHAISVKAGAFRASVPIIDPNVIPDFGPDARLCDLADTLRPAIKIAATLAKENSGRAVTSSVLVREGSCFGTTGTALLEAWHGLSLPTMALPKKAADTLCKIAEPIVGFGFSGNSATFYFEGGAWMKTQLMAEQWPGSIDALISAPSAPVPMPSDFWTAYDALESFIDAGSGYVFLGDDHLRSERVPELGAVYQCAATGRNDVSLAADLLDKCRPHMLTADFTTHADKLYFFGEGVRGIVMYARPH